MTLRTYLSFTDFTANYSFNSSVEETPSGSNSDRVVQEVIDSAATSYTFRDIGNAGMLFLRNLGNDAGGNLIGWSLQGSPANFAACEYYLSIGESSMVPILPGSTSIFFITASAEHSFLELYLMER